MFRMVLIGALAVMIATHLQEPAPTHLHPPTRPPTGTSVQALLYRCRQLRASTSVRVLEQEEMPWEVHSGVKQVMPLRSSPKRSQEDMCA